ncbi:MAG: LacI family DNA-binding transcriptional regulator [Lachnospiraceae bacterium]|nr:LacI family DNA-binding transcriptional regulator [Lachnospiraceae bacterium]
MATLKDVAEKAGVSSAAASRILNNDASLSVPPETRQKVLEAAKALNYRKKQKSAAKSAYTMGILQWFSSLQELEDSYYLSIRQGIEDFCLSNCLNVIRTFKSDLNCMDSLSQADGLICIGKFTAEEVARFKKVSDALLLIDMASPDLETSSITLDFEQAVSDALDYLFRLGHRDIAYLGGLEYLADGSLFPDSRKNAFTACCQKLGITYLPYIKEDLFSSESGYRMMTQLLESGAIPSAVFAASDPIALGALNAAKDQGFKIPGDISFIGFDDISLCKMTSPPLTTVHAPAYEMGQYGAGIVYHLLKAPFDAGLHIKMPCRLALRDSCREKRR